MRQKSSVTLLFAFVLGAGCLQAWSQNVTITPLGAAAGEFCVGDRALLFQDPTGVRVLTAPGRTVNGSGDPRIAPLGSIHVVLVDHPHVDHLGDVFHNNCAGTSTSPFEFPQHGNAPEIAARHNSAVLVPGEQNSYFIQKIRDINGTAPAGCAVSGSDNVFAVPRSSPCVNSLRGGTMTASLNGQPGVKITTIPAWHAAGINPATLDSPGVAPGLTGYAGSESGYIIRFTNGLTVLWTGDSGLIGDWATQSAFYHPNLAVVHMGDIFTMGPDEAAFAINNLIKPNTVIPEHANQVSTSGGTVLSGTRVERFINQLRRGSVIVPLSGVPISCDGEGRCRPRK
jgi:L-ascorbate metabolism protein UlaG (beta-lactamase superfamily)